MTMADVATLAQVSVDAIQHDLLTYLRLVESGETFIILKEGKPVAELKPVVIEPLELRPFGLCAGEFVVPDDFDAPLPVEVLSGFEGR